MSSNFTTGVPPDEQTHSHQDRDHHQDQQQQQHHHHHHHNLNQQQERESKQPTLTQQQLSQLQPNSPTYYQKIQRLDNDVLLACDRLSKTNFYAIKLLQLDSLDDVDFKLLTHDIQVCNQLRHPNILQYLHNFIHYDQIWIVSTLCSFTSADRLSKPFGLPELAIAFIIKDILNALDYLHQRGLIHRSIRASHILIKSDGHCLLSGLKYSVSCIADGKRQPYMHQYPLKARPNINWFSPEILEQNLFGYNHKSDIYSLGITCCELANGVVPFSDLQPTEMLLDKLTGNAPRLLDQTCQELVNLKPSEMSPEDRDKFFVFRSRQFSNSFHTFTSGLCLNFDPQKRPEAKKLLSHNFIKQLRKAPASSLLDFLDPSLQVINPANPMSATSSSSPSSPSHSTRDNDNTGSSSCDNQPCWQSSPGAPARASTSASTTGSEGSGAAAGGGGGGPPASSSQVSQGAMENKS